MFVKSSSLAAWLAAILVSFLLLADCLPIEESTQNAANTQSIFSTVTADNNSSSLLEIGEALSKLFTTIPSSEEQVKSSLPVTAIVNQASSINNGNKITSSLTALLSPPQPPPALSSSAVGTGAPGIPEAMIGIGQRPFAQTQPISAFPPDAIFSVAYGINPGLDVAVLTQVPGQVNGKGGPKSGAPGTLFGPPLKKPITTPTTNNIIPNTPRRTPIKRFPPQNNQFQSSLYNMVRGIQMIQPPNPYLSLLPTPPQEGNDPFSYVNILAHAFTSSSEEARKLLDAARKLVPGTNLLLANSANSGNSPGNNGSPIKSAFRPLNLQEKLALFGIQGPTPANPNGASPGAPVLQFAADAIPPSLPKALFLFNLYQPGHNLVATPSALEWILEEVLDFQFTAQLLGSTSYYDNNGAG